MARVFTSNNGKIFAIKDLEITNILNNPEILSEFSLKELDVLYNKYFGDYQSNYPYILQEKIKLYDSSKEINGFNYKDQEYWFDKNTRVSLMNLLNCTKDNVEFVLGDDVVSLSKTNAKKFLSDLEIYASKCYINTKKHLANIKNIKSIEELINYDYTTGYPDKITLNE